MMGEISLVDINYDEIGLKIGLEIHQQLNTESKLFCNCKTELFKDEPETTFLRQLRPTQSELGQIDPAAYFEFQKGTKILYEGETTTSCLVEMDEEPPHKLNPEALKASLTISLMLNATPIDELHVMRKTVIDGSTTTGFQRTSIVALNGEINVKGKRIAIQHVGLEEDAARKMPSDSKTLRYRIDRLCIPLVEIATSPTIKTPEQAREVALAIGGILRATEKVKRGLGTIRQDLNISIRDGALVEIKGVQELELVSLVIENEVQRQLKLLEIQKKLLKRNLKENDIKDQFFDVTETFTNTTCKVIKAAIKIGKKVYAAKLPKFKGLLKEELVPNLRLGTEMADRARFWGPCGGLFHTDEMPAYGITGEEIQSLALLTSAQQEDAIVFVAENMKNAQNALKAVIFRAKEALTKVPEETRAARPDGTTRYMRPRPGAARMYPETDIPPIQILKEYVHSLQQNLPELPKEKMHRLTENYHLNPKVAKQILDSKYIQLFEEIIKTCEVNPTFVAVTLTETLKALRRDGTEIENVTNEQLKELFSQISAGKITKEVTSDIILWLSRNKGSRVTDAIDALNLKTLEEDELQNILEETISENRETLIEHKEKAFNILMGMLMKQLRGRIDAKRLSELVREEIKKLD
jgi:glutamyl-tRNA(Gln) amidotransferase subunit E